jgi:hypothetical protein
MLAIFVWGFSYIILAGFGMYVVIRGQQIQNSLCEVSDDNRSILSSMLDVSERQALDSLDRPSDRNLVRQNFNELRALIPALKCSVGNPPTELEGVKPTTIPGGGLIPSSP